MPKIIAVRAAETDSKCSRCKGSTCCTYITQQIDTPRSMEDFDLLLWQISHRGIQIFKDEDGWFVQVMNRCRHLQADGRCGIYETRPQICRDHSVDNCEFDGLTEEDHELLFEDYASLLKYCQQRFKRWDRRFDNVKRRASA
jgi:Fe-S-cluster containining protein